MKMVRSVVAVGTGTAILVLGVVGPAAADYKSGTQNCPSSETAATRSFTSGESYVKPPGGYLRFIGNFNELTTKLTLSDRVGGGAWNVTADLINRSGTYGLCTNISP